MCAFGLDKNIQFDDDKLYIIEKSDKGLETLITYSFFMHFPSKYQTQLLLKNNYDTTFKYFSMKLNQF